MDRKQECIELLKEYDQEHIVRLLEKLDGEKQEILVREAKKIAREVGRTKIEAKLDPMNSYERRLIHTALADNKYVVTESVGEEPNRCLVIKPKKEEK